MHKSAFLCLFFGVGLLTGCGDEGNPPGPPKSRGTKAEAENAAGRVPPFEPRAAGGGGPVDVVRGKGLEKWIEQFERGDALERREAVQALGEFGKYAGDERVVQRANPVTGVPEPFVLAKLGADAVGALAKALTDSDVEVRLRAAHALGKLGRSGKAAEPSLRKALKDREESVRGAAAKALKQINGGEGGKGQGDE